MPIRLRHIVLTLGSIAVLGALYLTDPDNGLSTGMLVLGLLVCVLALALSHLARKALFDYPEADMRRLFAKAGEDPVGAGLALIALSIVIGSVLMLFGSKVHAATLDASTYLPPKAVTYAPVLKAEQAKFWSDHPAPSALAGLVEQESCTYLGSPSCWSPAAKLKTSREEGAGMGQITRAWAADGALRFDSLASMRQRYPDLQGWNWSNVYQRPDLQLRAIVLMSRENFQGVYRLVPEPTAALAFADAAYNGGMGGVQSDRRACNIKPGCNPDIWFGHVELTCTKSRAALYGNRSACDINREHVHNVILVRSPKYRGLMGQPL
jgi:hypothetical protein